MNDFYTDDNLDLLVKIFQGYMSSKHDTDLTSKSASAALRENMLEFMNIYRSKGDTTKGLKEINTSIMLAARDRYAGNTSRAPRPAVPPAAIATATAAAAAATDGQDTFLGKLQRLKEGRNNINITDSHAAPGHGPGVVTRPKVVLVDNFFTGALHRGTLKAPELEALRSIHSLTINRICIYDAVPAAVAPRYVDVKLTDTSTDKAVTLCAMVGEMASSPWVLGRCQGEKKVFTPRPLDSFEGLEISLHAPSGAPLDIDPDAVDVVISLCVQTIQKTW